MNANALHAPIPAVARIYEATTRAFDLSRAASESAGAFLLTGDTVLLSRISDHEQEIDRIDREVDDEIPAAIAYAAVDDVHLLLTCMKCVVDLERASDLVSGFANRAAAIHKEIRPDDLADLSHMATTLARMHSELLQAFATRDVNRALTVLRQDGEIDRQRNLIFLRHVESSEASQNRHAMHILVMAQSLERAGDHLKNVAEEVCHLVTGRTIRHALRGNNRSYEQLFIQWLKQKHSV